MNAAAAPAAAARASSDLTAAVQLSFDVDGLDPYELARLEAPARGALYAALELNPLQISCAEEAVRLVRGSRYGRAGR